MRDESDYSGHPHTSALPLVGEIAFPYMEDDEWKCVDQREHKHSPGDPVVPHVEFLVGDACQSRDGVCLCTEDTVTMLAVAGDTWQIVPT